MDYTVITYITYITVSIALTFWVARTLFRNGRIFLVDIFKGNEALADSVNRLLLVGFYLINVGYAVLALQIWGDIETVREMIEALSLKLGAIIIVLGVMHFFNLFIFFTRRKKAQRPAPPQPPRFRAPGEVTN
jgi:hypothetical protein